MEKLTQKWAIVSFFDEIDDGYEFHRTDNPLHITLAGTFAINKTGQEIYLMLYELLKDEKSYTVQAGDDVLWGENKDIRVVIIEKSEKMFTLQMKIYEELLKNGAVFNEPQHEGLGHILHSTVQKSSRLHKGDSVRINSVSLVAMFPDSDGNRRRIVKTIRF